MNLTAVPKFSKGHLDVNEPLDESIELSQEEFEEQQDQLKQKSVQAKLQMRANRTFLFEDSNVTKQKQEVKLKDFGQKWRDNIQSVDFSKESSSNRSAGGHCFVRGLNQNVQLRAGQASPEKRAFPQVASLKAHYRKNQKHFRTSQKVFDEKKMLQVNVVDILEIKAPKNKHHTID